MNIPDNYSQWEAHEAAQEKALADCYHCDHCGQAIQDEYYYEINGEFLCEDCMKREYRKAVEIE